MGEAYLNPKGVVTQEEDLIKFMEYFNEFTSFGRQPLSSWNSYTLQNIFKINDILGEKTTTFDSFILYLIKLLKHDNNNLFKTMYSVEDIPFLFDINTIQSSNIKQFNLITDIYNKKELLSFLGSVLNFLKLYKDIPVEKDKYWQKFIKEYLHKAPKDIATSFFPKAHRYYIGTNNEEILKHNYEVRYDFKYFKRQIRYCLLQNEHIMGLDNILFDYKEMVFMHIIYGIFVENKTMEEVYLVLKSEEQYIKNENSSIIFDFEFLNMYIDYLTYIKHENKKISFALSENLNLSFIQYSGYITNLHQKIYIDLSGVEFSKISFKGLKNHNMIKKIADVYKELFLYINYDFLNQNIERDLFIKLDKYSKTNFMNYILGGSTINLDAYYPYPPVFEVVLNENIIKRKSKNNKLEDIKYSFITKKNLKDTQFEAQKKWILDIRNAHVSAKDSSLYFTEDYCNSLGLSNYELNTLFTLQVLKNNKGIKTYLNTYFKNIEKEFNNKNILPNLQEVLMHFIDLKYLYQGVDEYICNFNSLTGIYLLLFIKTLSKNKYVKKYIINRVEQIKSRLEALSFLENNQYIKDKELREIIYKDIEEGKLLYKIFSQYKRILFVKEGDKVFPAYIYFNISNINTFKYKKDTKNSLTLLRNSNLLSKIPYNNHTNPNEYRKLLIEYDVLLFLMNDTAGFHLDIAGNVLNDIIHIDLIANKTLRQIYDLIYFYFSNEINTLFCGMDVFIIFLLHKIDKYKLIKLIYNEFRIKNDIDFIARVFDKIKDRNSEKYIKILLKEIKYLDKNLYGKLLKKLDIIDKEKINA